mgnify:CR=1 FL=1
MRIFLPTLLIAFVLDQASKYGVMYGMGLREKLAIEVLPPILNFHMGWNTGINFGMLDGGEENNRWVLVALSLVISMGLFLWGRRNFNQTKDWAFAGLIIGGALGNALDRVVFGAVADFLNVTCCGFQNPYIFNVADIFIFAGAIGLIFFHAEKDEAK